jgi:gluconokinase
MPDPGSPRQSLILTLDVGSSSVRALLFDSNARSLRDGGVRIPFSFRTGPGGQADADADALTGVVTSAISQVLEKVGSDRRRIAGVAFSTFWHNVLGVDENARAITPIYSWADTQSVAAAETLRQRLNEQEVHARTGCVLHPSYLPAKLLWIQQTNPPVFRNVVHWMSYGEYLLLKLLGRTVCSLSMASGTGLFDQNLCQWDPEILSALNLEPNQLSPLADFDQPLTGLLEPYRSQWPELQGLPWFPALGDGACSNIGSGCLTRERVALMVGTSGAMRALWPAEQVTVPSGLWCYRADRRRVLMGGALSNGGLLFEWMKETLRLEEDFAALEQEISRMKADSHGLTLLPFLAGERSPGWNANARAVIAGLSSHHRPIDILRAGLEAVAYRFSKVATLLKQVLPDTWEVIASGGALLKSPTWTQIMADVLGRPLTASPVPEASSRGAALMALEALGLIQSIEEIPAPLGSRFFPDMKSHKRYQAAMQRQDELYRQVIGPS